MVGSEAALERGRQPPHERVTHFAGAQRAAYDVPERTLLRREVPDVFGEQIDLHPRVGAVGQIVALAAAVHRPIVRRLRHVGEDGGIDIVRKHVVENEMIERCLVGRRRFDRADHELAQPLGRKLAAARRQFNGLVHS